MHDIIIPDDSTRPEIPQTELTEQQRQPMRHLRAIHEHHRRNMRMMAGMLEGVRKGDTSASELHAHIKDNPIVENYRVFGNLCGQHCQLVNGHHSIEDAHMFPALEGKNAALDKIVQRLREEHEVVHALLIKLAGEAEKLIKDPSESQFDATVLAHERLATLLLSHFGYEEDSVGPALGLYDVGI
ncbi:hemerythrin domain-containing protein [Maritalea porphyrae]|uniref:hemerythrin domain-containing protein n=1 Tax=Maritalea porphyrae TaxID=880732 RepID=UPI0022AEB71F|nr:hemerythrin domain-containing protein [Maritalea porphyrae]MCZ4271476.1 hemerythrin domain-containing protein [Maritalea porphyrae]